MLYAHSNTLPCVMRAHEGATTSGQSISLSFINYPKLKYLVNIMGGGGALYDHLRIRKLFPLIMYKTKTTKEMPMPMPLIWIC